MTTAKIDGKKNSLTSKVNAARRAVFQSLSVKWLMGFRWERTPWERTPLGAHASSVLLPSALVKIQPTPSTNRGTLEACAPRFRSVRPQGLKTVFLPMPQTIE